MKKESERARRGVGGAGGALEHVETQRYRRD